jgi:hypothetical protein
MLEYDYKFQACFYMYKYSTEGFISRIQLNSILYLNFVLFIHEKPLLIWGHIGGTFSG